MKRVLLALCLLLAPGAALAQAPSIDQTIVFIQCTTAAGVSNGTGVLVSADGHVLTAAHVAPEGASCAGSIGTADPGVLKRMVIDAARSTVDARLLRFSAQADYPFVGVCKLERGMARKPIIAAGFPANTRTGAVSFRQGVLSTVIADERGVIESDAQTVGGMSGGPVFSKNLAGIVGIVVGVEYNNEAEPSYGILSATQIARDFELPASAKPCFAGEPTIELPFEASWDVVRHQPDKQVGVTADQALCAISAVYGNFNDDDDRVELIVDAQGGYVFRGENASGGKLGARVRCVRLE